MGLIFIFLVYALVDYLALRLYSEAQAETFRNILRATMAFFSVICLVAILVFGILGLVLASYFKKRAKQLLEDSQYQILLPEQVIYLAQGNLAGLFAPPVFAFGNRLYLYGIISLLALIVGLLTQFSQVPSKIILQILGVLIGIPAFIIAIILAIKGRLLAWEKSKWPSFDQFKKRQKIINWLAILFLIAVFVLLVFIAFSNVVQQRGQTLKTSESQIIPTADVVKVYYEIASAKNPEVNNFDLFKNGYEVAQADKDILITSKTINSQDSKYIKDISFRMGYGMGLLETCTKEFKMDENTCVGLVESKASQILKTDATSTEKQKESLQQNKVNEKNIKTFQKTNDQICKENNKPIIRMFSTSWCPHCKWIFPAFETVVKEYENKIIAYDWQLDTNDNTLTPAKEGQIPETEISIFNKYSPQNVVPTFVFGCRYYRIGNGYEVSNNLEAEKSEFRNVIDSLINQ